MLFDYLKSIICTKEECTLLDDYTPYLIIRWLSFGFPASSIALNETLNMLNDIPKDMHYKLLLVLFPKLKFFNKINYIKRKIEDKEETENTVQVLAQHLELSQREIKESKKMVEFLKLSSK